MKPLSNNLDKQEVLQRLRQVKPESARGWGKMTAAQMICHLNDSFKSVMGERSASSAFKPGEKVRGMNCRTIKPDERALGYLWIGYLGRFGATI